MTATVHSVYPPSVSDLLPRARTLAGELGAVPSRNRLMTEFRIGAPKANAIRDALLAEQLTHPAGTGQEPQDGLDPAPDPGTVPPVLDELSAAAPEPQTATVGHPDTVTAAAAAPERRKPLQPWPLVLLALPAFVAVWSGWVGLGSLTGFGVVHPLPGIADGFSLNTAITLPIGVETYAAFALRVWLSGRVPVRARSFARWSAIGALALGSLGQIAYHVLAAAHWTAAPWWLTAAVATLPVAVLGMGAALAHLMLSEE